ncbi:MAG: O-antigen ligase family protein [Bacteroidia bacterium]|nr:O-antigen ligase family protein [Bacteroidia bacterium]
MTGDVFASFPKGLPFYYRFRTAMEVISGLHPSYFSLLLLFSCLFFIDYIIKNAWRKSSYLLILMLIVMLVQAAFLASRIPLAAFAISLIIMLLLSFKNYKVSLISTVLLFVIGFAALMFVPSISERVNEITDTKWVAPEGDNFNATNIRVGIYQCSTELLKENWLFGLGYGDIQENLNKCYEKFGTDAYIITPYNTHNIYLNAWLGSGILGLIALLAMLLIPLIKAVRERHAIYAAFIVFFLICGLTENILNRQIGVVFYCYINLLLFNREEH